ncbi:Hypothetical protein MVR_LOCUS13 [uncultured virus]|nr:Hypothetical protein MVR_LOCUS13 [uncultured virus]
MKLHGLPFEILGHLFGFIEIEAYLNLRLVNRELNACVKQTFGQYMASVVTSLVTSQVESEALAKLKRFVQSKCSLNESTGTLIMSNTCGVFGRLLNAEYYNDGAGVCHFGWLLEMNWTSTVTSLDLSHNNLTNTQVLHMLLTLLGKVTIKLKHLNLAHNHITDFSCIHAISFLFDNCIIDLSHNPLDNNQFNDTIPNVRHVTLQYNKPIPAVMPKFTYARPVDDTANVTTKSHDNTDLSSQMSELVKHYSKERFKRHTKPYK